MGKTSLGDPPCILDVLSMSTGVWVNEVQGAVWLWDVGIPHRLGNHRLSTSTAHYASAWQYVVLDGGEKGSFVAGINRHDQTFLAFPAYSPKHPLTFHHSTSMALPPAKLGLVNLNNLTRTPSPPRTMSTNNFCTNLAAVIRLGCLHRSLSAVNRASSIKLKFLFSSAAAIFSRSKGNKNACCKLK